MAKKDDDKKAEKASVAPAEFKIRVPTRNFRGTRFGVKLFDGEGITTDAEAAEACCGAGYEVTGPDGKVRNPLK